MSRRIPRRFMRCFYHFQSRLHQRVSKTADAKAIWHTLIVEIEAHMEGRERPHLSHICRVNKKGRRLWLVRSDMATFFVIFDHTIDCPITVIPPSGQVKRIGGAPVNLEEFL